MKLFKSFCVIIVLGSLHRIEGQLNRYIVDPYIVDPFLEKPINKRDLREMLGQPQGLIFVNGQPFHTSPAVIFYDRTIITATSDGTSYNDPGNPKIKTKIKKINNDYKLVVTRSYLDTTTKEEAPSFSETNQLEQSYKHFFLIIQLLGRKNNFLLSDTDKRSYFNMFTTIVTLLNTPLAENKRLYLTTQAHAIKIGLVMDSLSKNSLSVQEIRNLFAFLFFREFYSIVSSVFDTKVQHGIALTRQDYNEMLDPLNQILLKHQAHREEQHKIDLMVSCIQNSIPFDPSYF